MFAFADVGLRLREFRPSSDSEHLLTLENEFNSIAAWSSPVPKGAAWKDQKVKAVETQTEMCCVIETISPPDGSPSTSPSFVGIVALWINAERAHRHAKYTISLGPQFQNKGYGTKITKFMVEYGFQYLNLHRISAVIPDGNDAAVAVCKQSGFTDEGRERKARWQNGEWRDNILLGVLVDDWRRPKE